MKTSLATCWRRWLGNGLLAAPGSAAKRREEAISTPPHNFSVTPVLEPHSAPACQNKSYAKPSVIYREKIEVWGQRLSCNLATGGACGPNRN
jgi:hypothetical protein